VITVNISQRGKRLAIIQIQKLGESLNGELGDYSVVVVVERGNDVVSVLRRPLDHFPRNAVNSIGLLKAALNLFTPEQLGMEDGYVDDYEANLTFEGAPANMDGGLGRIVRALQGGQG